MTSQVIIFLGNVPTHHSSEELRKKEEKLLNFMAGAHLLLLIDEMPLKAEIYCKITSQKISSAKSDILSNK